MRLTEFISCSDGIGDGDLSWHDLSSMSDAESLFDFVTPSGDGSSAVPLRRSLQKIWRKSIEKKMLKKKFQEKILEKKFWKKVLTR